MKYYPESLPKLSGDTTLVVFTHQSVKRNGVRLMPRPDYGDSETLALIGLTALQTSVTSALIGLSVPPPSTDNIVVRRDEFFDLSNIKLILDTYYLMDKLIIDPTKIDEVIRDPKEIHFLMNSYVGGVYMDCGQEAIDIWIERIIFPSFRRQRSRSDASVNSPMRKRARHDSEPESNATDQHGLVPDSQTAGAVSLFQFNQRAIREKTSINFITTSEGVPHDLLWNAICMADGVAKGRGKAKSKQGANEIAAREAFVSLGWDNLDDGY